MKLYLNLLNGILHRAYEKTQPGIENKRIEKDSFLKEFERHKDFPYLEFTYGIEYKYNLNIERLDYRKINPLMNKLNWIRNRDISGSEYTDKINETFESLIRSDSFFNNLISKLKDIPIANNRVLIFEEMQFLFENKKWYSLYALALPQVEGIFSEIEGLIKLKKSNGSLTDKVKSMRKYYEYSHYTFDYYEFTLSDLRNSFSHTGKVEKPKFKCYHLLLDIYYLLDIFFELDTSISKLSKVIKDGVNEFKHIGIFSDLLNLIIKIDKENKLSAISQKLESFVYKGLTKEIDMKLMILNLEIDFKESLKNLNKNFGMLMREKDEKVIFEIFSNPISIIETKLKKIEKAYDSLSIFLNDDLKLLLNTRNFLNNFPKIFTKISKPLKIMIEDFKGRHQSEFKIILFLNSKIQFDIPDDFILLEKKLKHCIN